MYYVSPSISVCVQYHIIIYILTVTVGILLLYILIFQSCFYHGDMMEIAKKRREKR